jgi:hypothetical protein
LTVHPLSRLTTGDVHPSFTSLGRLRRGMKKVQILGLHSGWKDAPLEGETWGITGIIMFRPVSRVIDMHDVSWNKDSWLEHYRVWISQYKTEDQMIKKTVVRWHGMVEELRRINETKTPLYTCKVHPLVPTSIEYPIKEVVAYFGDDYFSSSFDYAIALAIYEGYERIDLWGVNMSASDEYVYQRPSFSYWLGMAKGMGINFQIHGETELLKTSKNYLYGYNTPRMVRNE